MFLEKSLRQKLCCDKVYRVDRQVCLLRGHKIRESGSPHGGRPEGRKSPIPAEETKTMKKTIRYYVLREKAVPEVLRKACEAHTLIESGKCRSVAEATEMTGISRSSYYKYKDDIFPYHEEKAAGTKVTMLITLDDEPGLLSKVLKTVADFGGNILTINQSIPVRGIAALTISFEVYPTSGEVNSLAAAIDETEGIHYVKILTQ